MKEEKKKKILSVGLIVLLTMVCLFGPAETSEMGTMGFAGIQAEASAMVTESLKHATFYGKETYEWADNGRLEFDCGDSYKGGLVYGELDGTGTYTYKNVGTYKGDFTFGQRAGEGTFTWKDGSLYKGEWYEDRMDGIGVYRSSDGYKLDGVFTRNKFTDGFLEFTKSGNTYQYEVANGKFTKQITIKYKNG